MKPLRILTETVLLLASVLPLALTTIGPVYHISAAPAPLVARQAHQKGLPRHCVMHWGSGQWQTRFYPGGHYEATTGTITYTGSWRLDALELHIVETTTPADPLSWKAWVIDLNSDLRTGKVRNYTTTVRLQMQR